MTLEVFRVKQFSSFSIKNCFDATSLSIMEPYRISHETKLIKHSTLNCKTFKLTNARLQKPSAKDTSKSKVKIRRFNEERRRQMRLVEIIKVQPAWCNARWLLIAHPCGWAAASHFLSTRFPNREKWWIQCQSELTRNAQSRPKKKTQNPVEWHRKWKTRSETTFRNRKVNQLRREEKISPNKRNAH